MPYCMPTPYHMVTECVTLMGRKSRVPLQNFNPVFHFVYDQLGFKRRYAHTEANCRNEKNNCHPICRDDTRVWWFQILRILVDRSG